MSPARALYALRAGLRALLAGARAERELDEELRFHLDRQVDELTAAGMDPSAARAEAFRRLGGVERRKDECREARGSARVEDLWRDIRYGLRALRRTPGVTLVGVLTLALGIGATTAIFTVVDGVLLRPLPYPDAGQLVTVGPGPGSTVAAANYLDWRAGAHGFTEMAAAEYWTPNLTGGDRPEELTGIRVTAGYLPLFGVAPALGRMFRTDEDQPGRGQVVVLRHEFWQRRFGGDPGIIGRRLILQGEPFTVVGVMPPGARFAPFWDTEADIAAPLVLEPRRTDRTGASLRVFGRLRPTATLASARADLASVAERLEREYPGTNRGVTIVPLAQVVTGDVEPVLLVLLAAVALVLLIACANVAHLQLIRAAARAREVALRVALGGSRGRVVQQSLVESCLLAAAGSLLGLLLAYGGVALLVRLGPAELPRLDAIRIDGRILAFLAACASLAAIGFGVGPALQATRVDPQLALREGGRSGGESPRQRRLRGALVVSEFALALMLLVGAGLVLRSFLARLAVDPGFAPAGLVSMQISVRGTASAEPARREQFFRQLLEQSSALPGVERTGAINHLPLHGDNWHFPFAIAGRPAPPPGEAPRALFRVVRPRYFQTMGIPLRQGRDFTTADETGRSRVVIINRFMADHYWPGETPIGQRLTVDDPEAPDWFTVVGVAGDVQQSNWIGADNPEMYFPSLVVPPAGGDGSRLVSLLNPASMTLVLRTRAAGDGLVRQVEQLVHRLEPDAPVSDVITLEQVLDEQFDAPRFQLVLLGLFALVAAGLAGTGVFGVISYSVARRRHEIGIRLALGAGRRAATRMVLFEALRLAGVGAALGLAGAWVGARFMRSLLYGVGPADPVTFAAVPALLAVVALGAAWLPALRAARVDPMVALRSD